MEMIETRHANAHGQHHEVINLEKLQRYRKGAAGIRGIPGTPYLIIDFVIKIVKKCPCPGLLVW